MNLPQKPVCETIAEPETGGASAAVTIGVIASILFFAGIGFNLPELAVFSFVTAAAAFIGGGFLYKTEEEKKRNYDIASRNNKRLRDEYEENVRQIKKRYRERLRDYNKRYAEVRKKNYARTLKKAVIEKQLAEVDEKICETEKSRRIFYSPDIIYNKYRNLTSAALLFEEFDNPHGSTGLKEAERKVDTEIHFLGFHSQLNDIYMSVSQTNDILKGISNQVALANQKLSSIISGQNAMLRRIDDYAEQAEANHKNLMDGINSRNAALNQINSSIKENSELQSYYKNQIDTLNRQFSYANWANYYAGNYHNTSIFRNNVPPV